MNQGARIARCDYLCFMENDIFVSESWLENLVYYLDNDICDVISPWQIPIKYEDWERYKKADWLDDDIYFKRGWQEQGIMLIRRSTFEKSGGWDERFKKVFGWKAYKPRLMKIGARIANTAKSHFTHIEGASYWSNKDFDNEGFRKQEAIEGRLIHDEF
jgi:GT2 family glycosyltransferase